MNLTQFRLYLNELSRVISVGRLRHNTRSQATIRREIRRRSNLPKATQKRLAFKCHEPPQRRNQHGKD